MNLHIHSCLKYESNWCNPWETLWGDHLLKNTQGMRCWNYGTIGLSENIIPKITSLYFVDLYFFVCDALNICETDNSHTINTEWIKCRK